MKMSFPPRVSSLSTARRAIKYSRKCCIKSGIPRDSERSVKLCISLAVVCARARIQFSKVRSIYYREYFLKESCHWMRSRDKREKGGKKGKDHREVCGIERTPLGSSIERFLSKLIHDASLRFLATTTSSLHGGRPPRHRDFVANVQIPK